MYIIKKITCVNECLLLNELLLIKICAKRQQIYENQKIYKIFTDKRDF